MSDMSKSGNGKKFIIALIIGIVALLAITATGVWYFSIWPFNKAESATVKGKEYFVFEVNDGIENHKAAKALNKLGSITKKKLDGFEWKVIEQVKNNLESTDITLTNKDNIGFVYILARLLMKDKEITNKLAEYELKEKDEKTIVQNVIKELACQIKLADVKGKVSLKEYNESLYALAPLKEKKEEHTKLNTDLAKKTAAEFILMRDFIVAMIKEEEDKREIAGFFEDKNVKKLFQPVNGQ